MRNIDTMIYIINFALRSIFGPFASFVDLREIDFIFILFYELISYPYSDYVHVIDY